MMKKTLLILLPLLMTACVSNHSMPQKVATKPISQCVYKSATTESEKAERYEQAKNLGKTIHQNWTPPENTKGKSLRAYFEVSPTCQITNILVLGNDEELKQSLITALQNTQLEGIDYQAFRNNEMTFMVK